MWLRAVRRIFVALLLNSCLRGGSSQTPMPGQTSRPIHSLTFCEFAGQQLICYKDGYYLRELILAVLKGVGLSPNIKFETNLFSLVKSIIREGMGISVFLRMVVAEDNDQIAISFDPPLYLDLLIAWKKHGYLSRANRAFVDFLLEQITKTKSLQSALKLK